MSFASLQNKKGQSCQKCHDIIDPIISKFWKFYTVRAIYLIPLYSCVAEKFEAIVSLGYEHSRFKDYYDLYVLARNNYFNGDDLTEAIKETFEHRNTSFDDIVAFEEGFSDDVLRQSRWNAFVKKKKPMIKITLQDSIDMIRKFIEPIVLNLQENKKFTLQWNPRIQKWE